MMAIAKKTINAITSVICQLSVETATSKSASNVITTTSEHLFVIWTARTSFAEMARFKMERSVMMATPSILVILVQMNAGALPSVEMG